MTVLKAFAVKICKTIFFSDAGRCQYECNDTVSCPMHETWKEFREDFLGRIANMTLADLVVELARKRA